MSNSISSIKTRIKSINSTKKITGAMKSVSTVKINRMTKITSKNNEYQNALGIISDALSSSKIDHDSQYCLKFEGKELVVVFASDVGLCGSYNESLVSYIKKNVKKNTQLYVIGTSIYNTLQTNGYNIINEQIKSDDIDYYKIATIYNYILDKFFNREIAKVNILYNSFVNSITYNTTFKTLLPFERKDNENSKEILIEQKPSEIFDDVIDLCLKGDFYNIYLNAKTSEQVARRFAMENATKNAEDLIDELTLDYNKARQGSITQEITEIVTGASAL